MGVENFFLLMFPAQRFLLDGDKLSMLYGKWGGIQSSIFLSDRKGRARGGVCLFLCDDMTEEVVNTFSNGVCEVLVVHVHQVNTIVTVVYRPPDTKLAKFSPVLKLMDDVFGKLPTP